MTEDPKDYKWSSYNTYAYGKKDPIVDEHPIYRNLSEEEKERRKKYRDFVRQMQKEKQAMKGEMDKRTIYGNAAFTEKIKKGYKVEEVTKPRGRPKKDGKPGN